VKNLDISKIYTNFALNFKNNTQTTQKQQKQNKIKIAAKLQKSFDIYK